MTKDDAIVLCAVALASVLGWHVGVAIGHAIGSALRCAAELESRGPWE